MDSMENKKVKCIRNGTTGECYDIIDADAQSKIEEVTGKLNEVINTVNSLSGVDGGHLATDTDIANIQAEVDNITSSVSELTEKCTELESKTNDTVQLTSPNTFTETQSFKKGIDIALNQQISFTDSGARPCGIYSETGYNIYLRAPFGTYTETLYPTTTDSSWIGKEDKVWCGVYTERISDGSTSLTPTDINNRLAALESSSGGSGGSGGTKYVPTDLNDLMAYVYNNRYNIVHVKLKINYWSNSTTCHVFHILTQTVEDYGNMSRNFDNQEYLFTPISFENNTIELRGTDSSYSPVSIGFYDATSGYVTMEKDMRINGAPANGDIMVVGTNTRSILELDDAIDYANSYVLTV